MKKYAALVLVALLQGCAFTTAHLDVAMPPDANVKGPLDQLKPTTFEIKPLGDTRNDTARIGYKKNGFGQNTADILTNQPVSNIVVDAVTAGLTQNGQTVGVPSDVTVNGSVTRFWFEFKPGMFTVDFTGNVECDLEFVSSKTGVSLYKSHYSGTYTERSAGGLDGTWTEVMDKSVAKLVEDVVFDPELVQALKNAQQGGAGPAATAGAAAATPSSASDGAVAGKQGSSGN
jgi:uncharacterized lipoprotein YajG